MAAAALDRADRGSRARDRADSARSSPRAVEAEAGLSVDFARLHRSAPQFGRLSDRTPILLMPLRIETRFKRTGGIAARDGDELWVRVYPGRRLDRHVRGDAVGKRGAARREPIGRTSGAPAESRRTNAAPGACFLSGPGCGPLAIGSLQTYRPLNEADQPAKADGVPTSFWRSSPTSPLVEPEKHAVSELLDGALAGRRRRRGADRGRMTTLVAAARRGAGARRSSSRYAPRNLADAPPAGADARRHDR